MVDGDWDRLRAFVIRDRDAAAYDTQRKFAEAIGVSEKSVNNFESGRNRMRRGTLSRVETVLNWVPGSAQVVLNGGEPSYGQRPTTPRIEVDPLRDETEREIWKLVKIIGEDVAWQHIDERRERLSEEERQRRAEDDDIA